jgi:hypothetical protein
VYSDEAPPSEEDNLKAARESFGPEVRRDRARKRAGALDGRAAANLPARP